MYKNYFIFARLAIELKAVLTGSHLIECWSQSKSILTMGFGHPDGREVWVELCVNPSMPFIFFRDSGSKASKNVAGLFENSFPSEFHNADISVNDRIVRLTLESGTFYYFVRGPHSNIFFRQPDGEYLTFKKIRNTEKQNEIIRDLESAEFTLTPFHRDFRSPENDEITLFYRQNYPFLGREIINEIELRKGKQHPAEIISELKTTPFSVLVSGEDHEVNLLPSRFSRGEFQEEKIFPDANQALREYILSVLYHKKYFSLYQRIDSYLKTEIENSHKRIGIAESRLNAGDKSEEYNTAGHLIMANLHHLKKGMKSAEVADLYGNGAPIKIRLREELTPYENAEYYYKKARGSKHDLELASEQIIRYEKKLLSLNRASEKLKSGLSFKELERLAAGLKLSRNEQKADKKLEIRFRHYIIDEKYDVYVGKDSKNNDLLTFRFGKPNDYWFHARGVPGSHVILKNPGKDGVPKEIIKKTASIAAYYSKAKNGSFVPVAYTFRKFVLKKKGLEQGQVILQRESVLMTEPGIPAGCRNPDAEEE